MIITISGNAGSGKSSVGKMLAIKLGYNYYAMGKLQRMEADKLGVSITELGEMEKKDPSIDYRIDENQRELGENEDNFIMDSWLGANFIPHAYKIFLAGSPKVRAERRMKQKPDLYQNIEEAMRDMEQREDTNRNRWINYYEYDYLNMDNYDLLIDTTDKNEEKIVEIILAKLPNSKYHPK